MARMQGRKLPRNFYDRDTLEVARDLLGKRLVWQNEDGRRSAKIVEVEAYIGQEDPACHAAPGPTKRNQVMFGPPGHAYIYLIYGMYNCLNFVTEAEGFGAAVLIRAAEPDDGIDIMRRHSPRLPDHSLLSGPGKLCRAFGLTTENTGLDLTTSNLQVRDTRAGPVEVCSSPRIGISRGIKREWRFFDPSSESLSRRIDRVLK